MKYILFVLILSTSSIISTAARKQDDNDEKKRTSALEDSKYMYDDCDVSSDVTSLELADLIEQISIESKKRETSKQIAELLWQNKDEEAILKEIKGLFKDGVDLNNPIKGLLPLGTAIMLRYFEIVKYFLEKGADVLAKDVWNRDAISIAKEMGTPEIIEIIKKYATTLKR